MTDTAETQSLDPLNSGLLDMGLVSSQEKTLRVLNRIGAARSEIEYAGQRDDGGVNTIEVFDENNNLLDAEQNAEEGEHQMTVADVLADLAESLVEHIYGDWESGNGGSGKLEINAKSGQMTLEFRDGNPVQRNNDTRVADFENLVSGCGNSESSPGYSKDSVATLVQTLRDYGITEIQATYHGCGDDGQPFEISAYKDKVVAPFRGSIPKLERNKATGQFAAFSGQSQKTNIDTYSALELLFEHLVSINHEGFETGEGGGGEICFNVQTGFVSIESWDMVENTETTTLKFAEPTVAAMVVEEKVKPRNLRPN